MAAQYAHPEVLVSTEWVSNHLEDPTVRIVESDEDILLYDFGHIPGAVRTDWESELQDPLIRDYVSRARFEVLMAERGISNETTCVFYGDKDNWWACYAFWAFKMFAHEDCRIMDGGRQKWIDEGRPLVKEVPNHPKTEYEASGPDYRHRAFRDEVTEHVDAKRPLIDVRSPGEYSGELLHMESYPQEGALRGGHIPGAASVPWGRAVDEDGTLKSVDTSLDLIIEIGKAISESCNTTQRGSSRHETFAPLGGTRSALQSLTLLAGSLHVILSTEDKSLVGLVLSRQT